MRLPPIYTCMSHILIYPLVQSQKSMHAATFLLSFLSQAITFSSHYVLKCRWQGYWFFCRYVLPPSARPSNHVTWNLMQRWMMGQQDTMVSGNQLRKCNRQRPMLHVHSAFKWDGNIKSPHFPSHSPKCHPRIAL
jgi:hypothetical protein